MLALDVSSFYQQADIIINTISAKVCSGCSGQLCVFTQSLLFLPFFYRETRPMLGMSSVGLKTRRGENYLTRSR